MESLALLCTLHADGPSSLRRLRRAGCASLAHLETLPPEDLAEILEVPPAVARRLGREARGLLERIDPGPLDDREEGPELGATARGGSRAPEPAGADPAGPSPGVLDRRDRALIDQVVGRWNASEPRPQSPARGAEPPPLVTEPLQEGEDTAPEAALAETVEARPAPEPVPAPASSPGLAGGEVDGLDAALATALNEAGVTDLEALARVEALEVARAVGCPFARLRRLQFLARRALPMEASAAGAPAAGTSAAEAPAAEAPAAQAPAAEARRSPVEEGAPVEPPPRPVGLIPATELELPMPRPVDPAPARAQDSAETPSAERGAAPRETWEPLPPWAAEIDAGAVEEPIPLPPEEPTPPASARPTRSRRPGRALNWTFEVPERPTAPTEGGNPAGLEAPDPSSASPAPLQSPVRQEDEGAAGPFA